jgi:hypothetical protein
MLILIYDPIFQIHRWRFLKSFKSYCNSITHHSGFNNIYHINYSFWKSVLLDSASESLFETEPIVPTIYNPLDPKYLHLRLKSYNMKKRIFVVYAEICSFEQNLMNFKFQLKEISFFKFIFCPFRKRMNHMWKFLNDFHLIQIYENMKETNKSIQVNQLKDLDQPKLSEKRFALIKFPSICIHE